jgi:25S rRNA (uracil2843-N3)-methyltransferase
MVKKPASKKAPRARLPPPAAQHDGIADQEESSVTPRLGPQERQRLLTLFQDAFSSTLSSDDFPVLLQEIKQALFNRDFAAAFGKEAYLEAYAARWSPTRALCYAEILLRLRHHIEQMPASDIDFSEPTSVAPLSTERGAEPSPEMLKSTETTLSDAQAGDSSSGSTKRGLRMLAIGGCAAEHVAFAAYLRGTSACGALSLLDSAPWASVSRLLQTHITSPPKISNYASAAAKAANKPLLDASALSVNFTQHNVLDLDPPELSGLLGRSPLLVTLLFTLNELYTVEGLGKTTKLLKSLGQLMAHGSLLLVVDSPGSYSEASIGQEKKRYPMQWLLNHTLVESQTVGYRWERLESEASTWFRLDEDLSYPIQLENMRYQLHLYRLHKV